MFFHFYKSLFAFEESATSREAREKCRKIIPPKISEADAQTLRGPITLQEVKNTIKTLNNDKALGPDGLTIEFYKANEDWVSHDLHELYTEVFNTGSLGERINSGIIKLLPKDGDKSLIKNWRPITLLNVSYIWPKL